MADAASAGAGTAAPANTLLASRAFLAALAAAGLIGRADCILTTPLLEMKGFTPRANFGGGGGGEDGGELESNILAGQEQVMEAVCMKEDKGT